MDTEEEALASGRNSKRRQKTLGAGRLEEQEEEPTRLGTQHELCRFLGGFQKAASY